jgi:hypothetical protein
MLSAQSKRYVLSHMCGCASQPMPTYLSSDWFIPFDLKWARQGELSTTASMDTQETVCSVTSASLCTKHDNRLAAVTPTTTCGQLPAVRPPRHQPLAGHILSMRCDAATHNIYGVLVSQHNKELGACCTQLLQHSPTGSFPIWLASTSSVVDSATFRPAARLAPRVSNIMPQHSRSTFCTCRGYMAVRWLTHTLV